MKKIIAFFFAISFFCISFSQGQRKGMDSKGGMMEKMKVGHFYGKIVDSISGKGIEFAVVKLLGNTFDTVSKTMKKDVVIAGQLTKANGDFSLSNISVLGKFTLIINAMGFKNSEQKISFNIDPEKMMKNGTGKESGQGAMTAFDKDLGNIKLKSVSTQLSEVTIEATVPVMEIKLDKKIFNVEKNMTATGGTAEDVLKNVPSVNVDIDGNVTMRNAAPQIFVDGRPTTLTIDQIPADAIKSIEIITNPSAKYDASGGQAGILNIVLKKERRIGYNGNIRMGIDQRAKINSGADINMREGKLNVFISGNLNQRYSITEGETERKNLFGNPLTNISQNNNSIGEGMFMPVSGGIDWFVDNRNTFTVSGKYLRGKMEPSDEINTNTDTIYSSYITSSSYDRISKTKRNFYNTGGSLQYKHLFPKEGKELTADWNYNKSIFNMGGDYETQYYDANKNPSREKIIQKFDGIGYNEIMTAQSDYIHPFNNKSKIETGVRGSYRNFLSKTENLIKNNSTGQFELIKNQNVNYKFVDQIYAAYFIYSKQKNKFSYQVGLRSESSFYTGELVDSNQTFKNYFPNSLFPSASATYEVGEKDNFQLSYAYRINRPSFFQMIPFTDYSDSLNLRRGNAGLKPEFTHVMELSYLKTINQTNNVLATIYSGISTGLITNYQMSEYNLVLQKESIINTYQNANASYVYGGEITSKSAIKKWLEFTLNFNAYYSIIDAKNIQTNLTNEQFSWFTKGNFTFRLPKNISIQLSPEYRSQASVPVTRGDNKYGGYGGGGMQQFSFSTAQGYMKKRYDVDVAIKYGFLKNKNANITINVRDIFASNIIETVTNSDYFNQNSSRIRDPRFVRINFSYRFGKFDASLFKRKNNKVNTEGMQEIQGM
ncbi:MAG: outer membrane beta-barrel protein [Bacteroidota bacterium]